MVGITSEKDWLRVVYSPRLHLAFYLFAMIAVLFFGAREAMAGRTVMAMIALGGGGALCLAAIMAFVEWSEVIFDAEAGTATLSRRRATGRHRQSLALKDILRADDEHAGTPGTSHRPVLILRDGQRIPTRQIYITAARSEKMVAAMNDWLEAHQLEARR